MRLCHSRMLFVRAYPRESQEMVFDAHERAFAFFGGACQRGIYDNMKTAVEAIFVGKERQYNRRFLQMCGHYLVEPVACTPASGWEKGQVENQVGLVRERFFTPRLRFRSYDEMNAWLLDQCVAYAKAHAPSGAARTGRSGRCSKRNGRRWSPIAAASTASTRLPASVSKTCLVRFDNNKYSVNARAVGPAGRDPRLCRSDRHPPGRRDRRRARAAASAAARRSTIPGITCRCWRASPARCATARRSRTGCCRLRWSGCGGARRSDDGDRQMVAILSAVLTDGAGGRGGLRGGAGRGRPSSDVIINILTRQRQTRGRRRIILARRPDGSATRRSPTAPATTARGGIHGTERDPRPDGRH